MTKFSNCLLYLVIAFIACDKDRKEGNLLVNTKHDVRFIGQATVYLKIGTDQNPNLPITKYDKVERADGTGDAYLKRLDQGKYFIYANGFDQEENRYVEGEFGVTVKSSFADNTTKLTIEMK